MTNGNGILSRLTVTRIPHLNIIVIKQLGKAFFISTKDSIVIDVIGLMFILKFLLFNGIISARAFRGLLEEYDDLGKDV